MKGDRCMKRIEIEKTVDNIVKYSGDPNVIFCELYKFNDRNINLTYRINTKTVRSMRVSDLNDFINDQNTFILKIEEDS